MTKINDALYLKFSFYNKWGKTKRKFKRTKKQGLSESLFQSLSTRLTYY